MKTNQALCANAIRKELKKAFPKTKFSITSKGFAGGDDVNINYIDGPSRQEVEEITKKYQYGHFDGMIDLYEDSNIREDIPQTKYLFVNRSFSPEVEQIFIKELCEKFGLKPLQDLGKSFDLNGEWVNFNQLIWRKYNEKAKL